MSAIVAGGGKVAAPVATEAPKTESTPAPNATVSTTTSTGGRINISPLAKKMASEKGIDISTVKGSGDNGRIVKKDIENYQPSAAPVQQTAAVSTSIASAPAAQVAMNFVAGETTETVNSQVRNVIAKRLSESKFTAPHYYLMVEINMDKAIEARKELELLNHLELQLLHLR